MKEWQILSSKSELFRVLKNANSSIVISTRAFVCLLKGIFKIIFIRLFAQTDLCQFWLVGLSSIEYHITWKRLFGYLGLIWTSKGWERIDSEVF